MRSIHIEQLTPEALRALADGDLEKARPLVPVPLTPWLVSDHVRHVWGIRAEQVLEQPEDLPWVTGVLVDADTGQAVGIAGFHAAPDRVGMVEAGYSVAPEFRRRGYARALLDTLVDRARAHPDVQVFRLTISPDNAPSTALAQEFSFVEVGEQWDEEDGLEIVFELPVSAER